MPLPQTQGLSALVAGRGGSISVSVPGKIILAGEHAVVYGRPALVAALDLRLTATLEELPGRKEHGIVLDLPGVSAHAVTSWGELRAYAERVRERWEGYAAAPSPEAFALLRGTDPAHVVKVALGEAALFLTRHGGGLAVPTSFRLRVDSDIPVGSGFGSSAATAVAVLGALFAALGLFENQADLERLALEVERRQHGSPSGVDSAAVLHGGILWARRLPEGGLERRRLPGTAHWLSGCRFFHTGEPPEATGLVVAAVRRRHDADRAGTERLLDRIAEATTALTQAAEPSPQTPFDSTSILDPIGACEAALEELGVVPEPVRRLVRQIEAAGGAAKVSGAGSPAGPGGGSLLVYHPDPSAISGWSFLAPYPCYAVQLGAPGLRRERAG
jgi:mevalonate kinase